MNARRRGGAHRARPARRSPGAHRAYRRGLTFRGTAVMTRLAWRRSRWFWLAWVVALGATMLGTAAGYETIAGDPAASAARGSLAANTIMRAMLGPPYDLLTPGGFVMWRAGTFVAAGAAMMASLGVIRLTRGEEEAGHTELLRSGAVGRNAPLTGAFLVALGACSALGGLIAAGLIAAGMPVAGSAAAGAGIALSGACWAGAGAAAGQVTGSARTARGLALGLLGAAYLLRALADGQPAGHWSGVARWASPVEWAALTRPYAGERWWVLALPAAGALALIVLACQLSGRRDHGAGLRAPRRGPSRAEPGLSSVNALALRLDRGLAAGWFLAVIAFAGTIGTLSGSLVPILDGSSRGTALLSRAGSRAQLLTDAFYVTMLGIIASVIAVFAVQLAMRLRQEEETGRAGMMLATATSRRRMLAAHVVPALVLPTVLLGAAGGALAIAEAAAGSSLAPVAGTAWAALVLAPGLWLAVGVTVAVIGWMPRAAALPWALAAWSVVMAFAGVLPGLPGAVTAATLFQHLPRLPTEVLDWTPVLAGTAAAGVLLLAGSWGFTRRDIPA